MKQLSPQQVVALVVRLFAIGLVIYVLRVFAAEIAMYRSFGPIGAWWYLPIVGMIIPAFVAAFLWRFPDFIARSLFRLEAPIESHRAYSVVDLYALGFVLLGVYLLYWAFSDTVYWFAYFRFWNDEGQFSVSPDILIERKAAFVATLAELFVAAFLILGNRKIAELIHRIRYGS